MLRISAVCNRKSCLVRPLSRVGPDWSTEDRRRRGWNTSPGVETLPSRFDTPGTRDVRVWFRRKREPPPSEYGPRTDPGYEWVRVRAHSYTSRTTPPPHPKSTSTLPVWVLFSSCEDPPPTSGNLIVSPGTRRHPPKTQFLCAPLPNSRTFSSGLDIRSTSPGPSYTDDGEVVPRRSGLAEGHGGWPE